MIEIKIYQDVRYCDIKFEILIYSLNTHIFIGNGIQEDNSSSQTDQNFQMQQIGGRSNHYETNDGKNKSTDRLMDINTRKTNTSTSTFLRPSQQKCDLSSEEGSESGADIKRIKNRKKGTSASTQLHKNIG